MSNIIHKLSYRWKYLDQFNVKYSNSNNILQQQQQKQLSLRNSPFRSRIFQTSASCLLHGNVVPSEMPNVNFNKLQWTRTVNSN
jgi:hypothetical protein